MKPKTPHFPRFSKLTRAERLQYLCEANLLTAEDVVFLNGSVNPALTDLAGQFIENVIGCFPIPLGVVPDFPVDGRYVAVPMAIEETSVIAAVSKMAKWIRQSGDMTTQLQGRDIIGQIQLAKVRNFAEIEHIIETNVQTWVALVNQRIVPNLVARGGGVNHIEVRKIARGDGHDMAVVHVLMHPCDAMGANLINQVCEFLRHPIEQATGEKVQMCILSNLVDTQLTEATLIIRDVDPLLSERIVEAGLFAEQDPYRAATHNKGVMNGMDAVLIATGNDWRAVEAGVHAYAARTGQYRSITHWQRDGRYLIGKIVAPVIVGTVGGVTTLHPTAQLNLRLMKIQRADELARIVAAIGLVQNLAALRALTHEGIVQGHMRLHIQNLLAAVGASTQEQAKLKPLAIELLKQKRKITQSDVAHLLSQWRQSQ